MRNIGLFNYTSLFGNTSSSNSLYSQLAQYSSIKSGAYAKLTKAYYGQNNDTAKKTTSSNKSSNVADRLYSDKSVDSVKALNAVATEANDLVTSATKLISTGRTAYLQVRRIMTRIRRMKP